MGKMLLVTGWVVTYTYIVEPFVAWYSGNPYEMYHQLVDRPFGHYAAVYWLVIFCNCIALQALWSRTMRTSPIALWIVATLVQVGMWSERFVIIVGALHRDFLPSIWRVYTPSWVDWSILTGTICFFLFLFLLFLRFVPFIAISEMKEMQHEIDKEESDEHAEEGAVDLA
jgi:molybdopterin-containing oxidoreductase family membrane subunit